MVFVDGVEAELPRGEPDCGLSGALHQEGKSEVVEHLGGEAAQRDHVWEANEVVVGGETREQPREGLCTATQSVLIEGCGHAGIYAPTLPKLTHGPCTRRNSAMWSFARLDRSRPDRGTWPGIVALVSDAPRPSSAYKERLSGVPGLSHVMVEVEPCPGEHPHLHMAA